MTPHQASTPTDPAAWHPADIDLARQTHRLDATEIAELEAALAQVRARGLGYADLKQDDVALPRLDATLARLLAELREGRGFVLLKGLPVAAHTKDEVRILAWVIATRLGIPVAQNAKGQLIADVMDTMKGSASPRGYHSNAELRLHTDPASDLIGLCCIEAAKEGGDSLLASAVTVHDTLGQRDPEALRRLYQGFPCARLGEGREDDPEVTDYPVPVLSVREGRVSCRFGSNRIRHAAETLGRPLGQADTDALAAFRDIAQEEAITFRMEAGDFLFCNNLAVLHARTTFVENDDPARPRHLLRFWLEGRDFRPVAPELNFLNRGRCGIVPRGGSAA